MRCIIACFSASALLVGCASSITAPPERSSSSKIAGPVHGKIAINEDDTDNHCGEGRNDCVIEVYMRPAEDATKSVDHTNHPHCYAYVVYGKTAVANVDTAFVVWHLNYPDTTYRYKFSDSDPVHLDSPLDFDSSGHIGHGRQRFFWHMKRESAVSTTYSFSIKQFSGNNFTDNCEMNDPTIANN